MGRKSIFLYDFPLFSPCFPLIFINFLCFPLVSFADFLSGVLSTCDIVTSYVQAQWLAAYLAGHIALRAPKAMALRYRRWRELFGPRCSTTALAVPRLFSYLAPGNQKAKKRRDELKKKDINGA